MILLGSLYPDPAGYPLARILPCLLDLSAYCFRTRFWCLHCDCQASHWAQATLPGERAPLLTCTCVVWREAWARTAGCPSPGPVSVPNCQGVWGSKCPSLRGSVGSHPTSCCGFPQTKKKSSAGAQRAAAPGQGRGRTTAGLDQVVPLHEQCAGPLHHHRRW